jgi:hypothetical protein
MREADDAASSARVEQAVALKEEGNAWLKQGDFQRALQKVHCHLVTICCEEDSPLPVHAQGSSLAVLGSDFVAFKRCSFLLQQG